jgi:hypothetical protein
MMYLLTPKGGLEVTSRISHMMYLLTPKGGLEVDVLGLTHDVPVDPEGWIRGDAMGY